MHEQFCRALQILENAVQSQQNQSAEGGGSANTTPRKINKKKGIERERNACLEIRQLLGGWESLNGGPNAGPQIQRHELGRAIGALFQLLDHREQALRFVADQTLEAIFRKFVLKFHAPKVIAFLLTEMSKKGAPGRALCAALQKLAFVIGHSKAQRASIYISHFLAAICQFLQRPEESVQICVDRQFLPILAHLGPFISAVHAEKAAELFEIAICNLEFGGPKNRAASTVIANLAKFVPSILHKSFYQLSRIIQEGDEGKKSRIAGALNAFRLIWPNILENLSESSAKTLQKLLCKVLCCLSSNSNEILVASLEFLQKCAAPQNANFELARQLGQFRPLEEQFEGRAASFGSPVDSSSEGREIRSKSLEDKFAEVETMSVLSMQTGNSSKMMSAWNSLDDLVAINQMFEGNEAEEGGGPWGEEGTENEDEDEEEEADKYSVISAEIFVDPLMNCFHQQQKEANSSNAEESLLGLPKSRRTTGTLASGSMTPNSTISRQGRGRNAAGGIQLVGEEENGNENAGHILEQLPGEFCNFDANFWTYSALAVARIFLLAGGQQGIRPDREVRVSHKILALDYIGAVAAFQNDLNRETIFGEDGHSQCLADLFPLVGHEDDNLAISALGLAFNLATKNSASMPISADEKNKLIWLLKKAIFHSQHRNPNRMKGILQIFANSLPLLYGDDQLMEIAFEHAFRATDFDYFLVKKMRADFFSQIQWAKASEKSRRKMQMECLNAFLRQIFDPDPRVQKGTLDVLGTFVRNADFGEKTNLFASIPMPPHCLEEAQPHKIPLLLGLDPSHYAFCLLPPSPKKRILAENLCQILLQLYKIALEKFSERQSQFLAALLALIEYFPPKSGEFASTWLTAFSENSPNFGQTTPKGMGHLPKGQNLLALLLECAEGISNLEELAAILRLIGSIFSAISEALTLHRCPQNGPKAPSPSIPSLWGFPRHNIDDPSTWANPIERCLLIYLRTLNLYYSIGAEERLQQQHKMRAGEPHSKAKMTLVGAGESIVSGAAAILSSPLNLLPNAKPAPPNEDSQSKLPSNSAKAANLTFLVGTGVKQFRQTSFTHSPALRALEPALRGAYRPFIECLDSNAHRRFLGPFEAATTGLCAFLEMADLPFIRPFLDELLIYLRMLMDISSPNSARLVHQLLKCLFNANAQNLEGKMFDQNGIWNSNPGPADPIQFYFSNSLNSFILFSAFVSKPEFTGAFLRNIGGWIIRNHLPSNAPTFEPDHQQQMNQLLHQFEPFITHLLKLYPIINSVGTRLAVLQCICTLCLCHVRYELLDRNGKFQSRVVGQLRQFCALEDGPLLPPIFAFLCLLARIQFIKFSEIENFLSDIFARLDGQSCQFALEAVKIVLLDVISFEERKLKQPEAHKRICTRIKEILCRGFSISFQLAPESAAQIWILLLHEMRQFHIQSWFEFCSEFFVNFSKFWLPLPLPLHSPSPPSSPSRFPCPHFEAILPPISPPNSTRQLFLHSILLCQCSLTIPINALLDSLQQLFAKLAQNNSEQILNCENQFLANFGLRFGPLLFVLISQIEEGSLEARADPGEEEGEMGAGGRTLVDYIGKNFASFLLKLLGKMANENSNNSLEGICLFLLLIIQNAAKSGKSPKFVDALKINLAGNWPKSIGNLAKNSPQNWAFWTKILFEVKIGQNICDFSALPSHCKFLFVQIFVDKICESKNREEVEEIVEMANLRGIMGEELWVEFMKIGSEKMFKKCIGKLQEGKCLGILKEKGMQIFRENSAKLDGLLHRFILILSKFGEDAEYSEILTKIGELEGEKSTEIGQILGEFLQEKPAFDRTPRSPSKFSTKEFSEELSEEKFYKILASHANNSKEFDQICRGMMDLEGEEELGAILDALPPWPIRRQFYCRLFSMLMENAKMEIGEKGRKKCLEFGSKLVQILAANILLKFDAKISSDEKIFVMAKIAKMLEYLPEQQFPENLLEGNGGEIVERLLNWPFVRVLVERRIGEGREMPSEYFRALKLFFTLNPVKSHYSQNDCLTLTSLVPFLTALWEQQEKQIPRWHRLQIDKQNWPIQVKNLNEKGEAGGEGEEEIHKMMALAQRIVFAIQNNLLGDEAVEGAFQAILSGISIFQRMALVPEKGLRSGWSLCIELDSVEQKIHIPLIQIHMLNSPPILQDFCWRCLWLGWSSRSQFEEFCMSLYGVLSSTPTTAAELRQRAESEGNGAVNQQLTASSLAIDALSAILLQTLLYPQPGNPVCSKFVVKHRKRPENYHLFLNTDYGKLAKRAKCLTKGLMNGNFEWPVNLEEIFIENLECPEEGEGQYGMGQTSLFYLWSMSGLLESVASKFPKGSPAKKSPNIRASTSEYLIAQSTELDTASSLRALFETFTHWLRSAEQCQLPLPILHSTLHSMALISDLFHDSALFKQTFAIIRPLMANAMASPSKEHSPNETVKGFCLFILLKCAAILDWTHLADNGEIGTAKFIESLVQNGLNGEQSQFVRICTLNGLLYILQSLAVENLQKLLANSMEFVLKEAHRMQHKLMTDILTECPIDLIKYQKLCWAFAFGLLQEAIPIEGQSRDNFLQLVKNSFLDPRLPGWLKMVLTRGIESLVLHSSIFAPGFRQMALECFETYQLQPGHLPFALSVYSTCAYRELQEGGEFAYSLNKTFNEDFQKLLNIFSFYSNSHCPTKTLAIGEFLSDLVSTIWAKEAILSCLWSMLIPPLLSPTVPKMKTNLQSPSKMPPEKPMEICAEFEHPLQPSIDQCPPISHQYPKLVPIRMNLGEFDQAIIHLLHLILKKLFANDRRACLELALNFVIPKLKNTENAEMARCLALMLLCSANENENWQKRVHFLLHSNPFYSNFFKATFPHHFVQKLVHSFLSEIDTMKLANSPQIDELGKSLNSLLL